MTVWIDQSGNFVRRTGDTMTGDLHVPTLFCDEFKGGNNYSASNSPFVFESNKTLSGLDNFMEIRYDEQSDPTFGRVHIFACISPRCPTSSSSQVASNIYINVDDHDNNQNQTWVGNRSEAVSGGDWLSDGGYHAGKTHLIKAHDFNISVSADNGVNEYSNFNFISGHFKLPTAGGGGSFLGTMQYLGILSEGDVQINTGKKLILEGSLSGTILTIGDTYFVYSSGLKSYVDNTLIWSQTSTLGTWTVNQKFNDLVTLTFGTTAINGTIFGFDGNDFYFTNQSRHIFIAANFGDIYFTAISAVHFDNTPAIFGDNTTALFGTGGDSSIYYDGTNMFINPKVAGTGYLNILGNTIVSATTCPVQTIAVNSAGSGYCVGDILTITGGDGTATFVVDGVNATGGVVFQANPNYPLTQGTGYSIASNISTTGGNGTGCTVDITDIKKPMTVDATLNSTLLNHTVSATALPCPTLDGSALLTGNSQGQKYSYAFQGLDNRRCTGGTENRLFSVFGGTGSGYKNTGASASGTIRGIYFTISDVGTYQSPTISNNCIVNVFNTQLAAAPTFLGSKGAGITIYGNQFVFGLTPTMTSTGNLVTNIYGQHYSSNQSIKVGIATATLGVGGSGYVAGDILFVSDGTATNGYVKVLTVDGSGAVLTFTIMKRGEGYTAGTKNTTGGTGTGCTITVGICGTITTNYYAIYDTTTFTGLTNAYFCYNNTSNNNLMGLTTSKTYFRDTNQYIYSSAASTLDIVAPTLDLNSGTNDMEVFTAAQKTVHLNTTVWKDVFFPQGTPKATGAGNPTLTNWTGGLSNYAYAVNDGYDGDPQEFPHDGKQGVTTASLHIHWISRTNVAATRGVKWQIEYTFVNIGGTFPATTTISAEETVPANTPVGTHFLTVIGTFTTPNIGAQMCLRVTRIAAVGTAPATDPIVLGVHYHYEVDTLGSRQISTK